MNATADIFDAVRSGDLDRLRRLVEADPGVAAARDNSGLSVLLLARYHGREEMVDALLAAGPALDIFEAAALGDAGRITALVASMPEAVHALSADGFTPLHLAAFFGRTACARLLIERDAEVNAVSRNPLQVMPLHSAAAGRHLALCALLIEHGADVNARQQQGFTPLHAAAQHGDRPLAELLLRHGADSGAKTDDGRAAAEFAAAAGHDALAGLLGTPTAKGTA